MTRVLGLLRSDVKNVARDPVLVLVTFLPFVIGTIFRFAIPFIDGFVGGLRDPADGPPFSLLPYYPFIQSFVILFAPCFVGWIIGLVLLDERDESILTVVAVTPLGRRGFLAYRLALPTAVAFIASLVVLPIAGLAPVDPLRAVLVVAMASLEAPLMTTFLVAFADNKVEGLAFAKGASVMLFAPLAIVLIEPPWQLLAGLVPPFWVSKAYLAPPGLNADFALALLAGLAVHGLALWILGRRFARRTQP